MDERWFVLTDDSKQEGPLTEEEVISKIQSGQYRGANMCWKEGLPEWRKLQDVESYAAALAARGEEPQDGSVQEMLTKGWSALRSTLAAGKESAAKMAHAAKLKMRVAKIRRDREEAFRALGEEVYNRRSEAAIVEPFRKDIQLIETFDQEIAALEKEIEENEPA